MNGRDGHWAEYLHVGFLSGRRDDRDRFREALALPLLEANSQVCCHVLISFFLTNDVGNHQIDPFPAQSLQKTSLLRSPI